MSNEPKIKKVTLTGEQAEKVTGGDLEYQNTPDNNITLLTCTMCNESFWGDSWSANRHCPACQAKIQEIINNGGNNPFAPTDDPTTPTKPGNGYEV